MSMGYNPICEYAIEERRRQLEKALIWYYPLKGEKEDDVFRIRVPKGSRALSTHHRNGRWCVSIEVSDPLADYDSMYFIVTRESNWADRRDMDNKTRYVGGFGSTTHYTGMSIHHAHAGHPKVVREFFTRY